MTKATEALPTTSPSINRRSLLRGGSLTAVAIASPAAAHASTAAPLLQLTPGARELFALRDQEKAARAALEATPDRPTDLDEHSDASPEWLSACDRYHAVRERMTTLATAKAKAITLEAIPEPLTAGSLVSLAAAADWYDGARTTLGIAVQHLAGDKSCPLDLYSAN